MRPEEHALHLVKDYHNQSANLYPISIDELNVVWFSYQLGGWKALVSTTRPDDQYYEVTCDREKKQTYLDHYRKLENVVIKD